MPKIEIRVFHNDQEDDADVVTLENPDYGIVAGLLQAFAAGFDTALIPADNEPPTEDDPDLLAQVRNDYPACETHCCPRHGCKYGYGGCPIKAGILPPAFAYNNHCEFCEDND